MGLSVKTGAVADKRTRRFREAGGKTEYRVDLPAYHADCDANYLRLRKLLPELANREHWRYQMPNGALELSVQSRSRYTTEVCLNASAETGERNWLAPPQITVRLYHDARMAEVVAVDGRGPVGDNGVGFTYPNPRMHCADERQQANRFLGEWLGHCLANGRAEIELILDGRRL
ncbi:MULTISPECIES: DUF1249 domain-containing protein [unclassified Microbulbifer]|uniref:DUF1249 domain-containing protein n=1 Tax=unclassified Microbulbifer TaxID=2619833 RepID=UPI0027E4420C|nr:MULTISPECIES: DUF1249 domain-containing protein [unclassified Microbulbifer]